MKTIIAKVYNYFLRLLGLTLKFGGASLSAISFYLLLGENTLSGILWKILAIISGLLLGIIGVVISENSNEKLLLIRRATSKLGTELLKQDKRKPIIYIRSFKYDDEIWPYSDAEEFAFKTSEEQIASYFNQIGPFIAIGDPKENIPKSGAARIYEKDENWQNKIIDLFTMAQLVVLRGGHTRGLAWEIQTARKILKPEQLICIIFEEKSNTAERAIDILAQNIGKQFPEESTNIYPKQNKCILKIFCFKENWNPFSLKVEDLNPFAYFRLSFAEGLKNSLTFALTPHLKRNGHKIYFSIKSINWVIAIFWLIILPYLLPYYLIKNLAKKPRL